MNNPVYKKDFDEITDKIKLVMGNSTEINFILVDYILPIKSGKYKYNILFLMHISEQDIKIL